MGTTSDEPRRELTSDIGIRIRRVRLDRNLTLTELARRVGISKSMLSQLETGVSNVSMPVLRAICHELDIQMFTLFVELDTHRSVIRRHERRRIDVPDSTITRYLLTPAEQSHFAVIQADIEPGARSFDSGPASHSGHECFLVLRGSIEVTYGSDCIVLHEGDTFTFGSTLPHSYRNTSDDCSSVIVISTRH